MGYQKPEFLKEEKKQCGFLFIYLFIICAAILLPLAMPVIADQWGAVHARSVEICKDDWRKNNPKTYWMPDVELLKCEYK